MGDRNTNLPPGFRFYPTDEELVVHFLQRKASLLPFHPDIIPDLELHPYDPWDLDALSGHALNVNAQCFYFEGKAMAEGKKWYFFSRKTSNRLTENGYWEALSVDEPIFSSDGKKLGVKKFHVFYVGEAPNEGVKTNWIMEEYRLSDCGSSSTAGSLSKRKGKHKVDLSKWVVCRVYEHDDGCDVTTELSCLDEVFLSMDDFDDISYPN